MRSVVRVEIDHPYELGGVDAASIALVCARAALHGDREIITEDTDDRRVVAKFTCAEPYLISTDQPTST